MNSTRTACAPVAQRTLLSPIIITPSPNALANHHQAGHSSQSSFVMETPPRDATNRPVCILSYGHVFVLCLSIIERLFITSNTVPCDSWVHWTAWFGDSEKRRRWFCVRTIVLRCVFVKQHAHRTTTLFKYFTWSVLYRRHHPLLCHMNLYVFRLRLLWKIYLPSIMSMITDIQLTHTQKKKTDVIQHRRSPRVTSSHRSQRLISPLLTRRVTSPLRSNNMASFRDQTKNDNVASFSPILWSSPADLLAATPEPQSHPHSSSNPSNRLRLSSGHEIPTQMLSTHVW
jgi:hypothetical protein